MGVIWVHALLPVALMPMGSPPLVSVFDGCLLLQLAIEASEVIDLVGFRQILHEGNPAERLPLHDGPGE